MHRRNKIPALLLTAFFSVAINAQSVELEDGKKQSNEKTNGDNNSSKNSAAAVDVIDFGAIPGGVVDSTNAIRKALKSGSGLIKIGGKFLISSTIEIPNGVSLVGTGYSALPGVAKTIIVKRCDCVGIVLDTGAQLANLSVEGDTNNGLDGIQIVGGRSLLQNISVFNMGRDGIKIGSYLRDHTNTNLWRAMNVISRFNGRHGIYIAHEGKPDLPDANAGIFIGMEASNNKGDGLRVGETFDNQFYGVANQANNGFGVNILPAGNGNYLPYAYTEENSAGGINLSKGADKNVVLGYRQSIVNDEISNAGNSNLIIGRYGSINSLPLHETSEAFQNLNILDRSTSGIWSLKKEPSTRNLILELAGTSGGGDILIKSASGLYNGLRFRIDEDSAALRDLRIKKAVKISAPELPPNSTTDINVQIVGTDESFSFQTTPIFAVPKGITWCVFWDPATKLVKLRIANVSQEKITVNGTFSLLAIKAM